MSLYKKSQEVLYADFIGKTFGEERNGLQKKLEKLGFNKVIAYIERAEAYDKYLIPCLMDPKIAIQSKANNKVQAIGKKLRLLSKYVNIKDFFIYNVNIKARKIKLLYGKTLKGKIKKSNFDKQLVISDGLLRTLNQKKLNNAKLEVALKKIFSWLDNTELDGCFFHVIRKDTLPQAIIVMRLDEHYDSYNNVETPLASLLDLAFSSDIKLKNKYVNKNKQEQLLAELITEVSAMESFNIPHIIKNFMGYFLNFAEDLNYKNGLQTLLTALRIQSLIVFEKEQPKNELDGFSEASEEATETEADIDTAQELFNITFCQGIDEVDIVMDIKIPRFLLTDDEKLVLHDSLFKDENFLLDKETIFLDVSETKKLLVLLPRKDFSIVEEMESVPAIVFFQAFLTGMLDSYHSRI